MYNSIPFNSYEYISYFKIYINMCNNYNIVLKFNFKYINVIDYI